MKEPDFDSLDAELSALPREIEPPDAVWRGVALGIHRARRRTVFALAAMVACVLLTGGVVWAELHNRLQSRPDLDAVPDAGYGELVDVRYTATRAKLEMTFNERLALLDPGTRARIESSLAVIHKAHEDIREALRTAPADPLLEQLFESTWHDEFDLYDRVIRGTQPTLARS